MTVVGHRNITCCCRNLIKLKLTKSLFLPPGPLFAKQDFLQPNISAGRPILRPATKPDSITGGAKIAGGGQRICNQPAQAAAEARSEDTSQASLMFAAAAQDALSLQSAGKQNSLTPSATAFTGEPCF